jgi:hypothetical protein
MCKFIFLLRPGHEMNEPRRTRRKESFREILQWPSLFFQHWDAPECLRNWLIINDDQNLDLCYLLTR